MPHTAAELRALADTVVDRDRFAAIFDEVAKGRTPFAFKLLAVMNSADPITKALSHADELGFLDTLVDQLMHAGQLDLWKVSRLPEAAGVTVSLHAVTRPADGIVNTQAECLSTLLAMRRMCCISVMNEPLGQVMKCGSGFLVGPQTVITSYHVIRRLLDDQGNPVRDSAERLKIVFDAVNGMSMGTLIAPHDAWLVDCSPPHPLEDTEERMAVDLDSLDPKGFDSCLDYAVILLSQAVGRERGYYSLDPKRLPSIGNVGAQVTLWQFHAGLPLATSRGRGSRLWPAASKSRLHHDANSGDGSSGGLLVDQEFKPVGLHQCGYHDADNETLFNGAIPTACIAQRGGAALNRIAGVSAMWRLDSVDEPLVGREAFQKIVLQAVAGATRIITVSGPHKTGRSFSCRILRSMLGTAEHNVVEMSASKLDIMAHETATEILRACGVPMAGALPDANNMDTAQGAWIRDVLFPDFAQRLTAHADPRCLWLVIDDIDRFRIADTSTRTFLENLYAKMESVPRLRLVLIGLDGAVPGASVNLVAQDRTREFDQVEMVAYLQRYWHVERPQVDSANAVAIVRTLLATISGDEDARQENLAAALAKAAKAI